MSEHGTRASYQRLRCRCFPCRLANALYQLAYRSHPRDVWIDAGTVRVHLLALHDTGCGMRQVARASGVSRSVLQAIATGARTRIRTSQALCVLAVSAAPADGTLVSAWQTKRWIRALLSEGFTKRRLADQLQLPSRQIHPHTTRVRRSTQTRIGALYHDLTAEGPDVPESETDAFRR
jgi:hypothetical protein